ncbi:sensor histidine kinase [Aliikangiella coralliicola]|uniref:histidine kinase n=1 Tax=Aliikangiella coralliicola TaxID=2592383 RepID=A0A545U519_9GAMM|nr:HAMP domain-containing sensor histidine kinase [Aliikangiella coralliicola]TQV84566.1 HAMP domain-containing histidine kinase [Aliikangiella coralliicola]
MVMGYVTFKSSATLKRQLLSFFIGSVVILSLTTSIITAWQTSRNVRLETIENGLQIVRNFSDQAILALLTGSEENAQEAVNRTLGFESINGVAVFKPNGELLISSTKSPNSQFYLDVTKLTGEPQLIDEYEDHWVFSAPVIFVDEQFDPETLDPDEETVEEQLIGHVLVDYDKHSLREIQQSIFVNNIVIGGVITVVLAFLMSWGVNRLTLPLSALSQTMETARDSGNYTKADVNGASEIRQMAAVYNQMMTHLEKQKSQLEMHRATLESEVEIRTQELRVARDTALTANRHKSEFLANISHELRTPLQAIIGYTDLVKEDLELECMDAQAEDLAKAIRSANTLLGLINNILDLAKIEAGRMDLYLKPVDMEFLINDTLETVQPMAAANNNQLLIDKGNLNSTLVVDRQKLMQIFLNLLSNACKFTKNGKVTFEIRNDKNFLYVSVTDTGVGIPKDKLNYIFEEFTQVDGSQTRKFEGTGLGMAITKNFCDMMRAKIEVESQEGEGTRFSIKLPLQPEQETRRVDLSSA